MSEDPYCAIRRTKIETVTVEEEIIVKLNSVSLSPKKQSATSRPSRSRKRGATSRSGEYSTSDSSESSKYSTCHSTCACGPERLTETTNASASVPAVEKNGDQNSDTLPENNIFNVQNKESVSVKKEGPRAKKKRLNSLIPVLTARGVGYKKRKSMNRRNSQIPIRMIPQEMTRSESYPRVGERPTKK